MGIKDTIRKGGSRALRVVMSGVVAVGLMPLPAFAADLQATQIKAQPIITTQAAGESKSIEGLVIASSNAAANPAPEILGLSNPSQRSASEGETTYEYFGDESVNSNPDPFLWNYMNGGSPSFYVGTHSGNPMTGLQAYGASAAVNSVWSMAPHIVLGTGADTLPNSKAYPTEDISKAERDFYDSDAYARAAETANDWDANSYHPIGITYDRVDLPSMVKTMYRLATAADEAIAASETTPGTLSTATISARYTDNAKGEKVMDIAKEYERYILGQKGLVKKAIDADPSKEKTIALVQSYDSSANSYTIITDGVAEGTATTNRYLEAVQGVTKNYYDTVGASGSTSVKAADLSSKVDYIIIGSNAGSDTNSLVTQLSSDGLISKTYYCVNWSNGSAFNTTVNSVENAQNVGRILPCVYPNILNQHDMVAYYYDVFYHVINSKLGSMIDEKMDGVRNGSNNDSGSRTSWSASDVASYNYDKVEAQLKEGVSYLISQTGLTDYLTPTKFLSEDASGVSLESATVTVAAGVGQAAKPEPTVMYGTTKLTKGTDYQVAYTYSDNTGAVGSTGTVTVTGTGTSTSGYYGTASATFKVVGEANFSDSTMTVALDKETYTFSGENIEPVVTVTPKAGGSALELNKDYTVSYANNKNAAAATAGSSAPTVTIAGIGDYSGTISQTFTIGKLKPTIALVYDKSIVIGDTFAPAITVDKGYTSDGGALTYTANNDKVISGKLNRGSWAWSVEGVGTATFSAEGKATTNCEAPAKVTSDEITVTALAKQTVTLSASEFNTVFSTATIDLGAKTDGGGDLSYESSNTGVATVSKGTVTLKGVGTATITVTAAEKKSGDTVIAGASDPVTCTVNVSKLDAQVIRFGGAPTGKITRKNGGSFDLQASTTGDGELSYVSDNPDIASVSDTGVVTLKGIGKANIVVTAKATENAGAGTATCEVQSTTGVTTIKLADQSKVYTGSQQAYTGTVTQTGSTKAPTLAYYSDAACTQTATPLNAGTYYVKATVADDEGYNGATSEPAKFTIAPLNISKATVTLNKATATYTGKKLTSAVTAVKVGSTTVPSSAYTAVSAQGTSVGTYKATVTGKAPNYTGTATGSFKINAASQTIKAAKTYSVKASAVKKAGKKIAVKFTANGGGKVTYAKASAGKLSIAKNGKVTVKKGTKKGTYSLNVKCTAAAKGNYAKTVKTVKLKVKVS